MMSIIRRLVCERFQNNIYVCVCMCILIVMGDGCLPCCYAKVARDKIWKLRLIPCLI